MIKHTTRGIFMDDDDGHGTALGSHGGAVPDVVATVFADQIVAIERDAHRAFFGNVVNRLVLVFAILLAVFVGRATAHHTFAWPAAEVEVDDVVTHHAVSLANHAVLSLDDDSLTSYAISNGESDIYRWDGYLSLIDSYSTDIVYIGVDNKTIVTIDKFGNVTLGEGVARNKASKADAMTPEQRREMWRKAKAKTRAA